MKKLIWLIMIVFLNNQLFYGSDIDSFSANDTKTAKIIEDIKKVTGEDQWNKKDEFKRRAIFYDWTKKPDKA